MTQKGYVNFIKDLQENGIDIYQCDFEGRNVFHIAARENNLNMIKFLLENSIFYLLFHYIRFSKGDNSVDHLDSLGRTPLYEAISQKNKQIIYELKNKGAVNFGKKELVRALLFR